MPDCPLCRAPESMLEALTRGYYCNVCGQAFVIHADGTVTRHPTQHEPPRKTDLNGVVIDGE